MQKQYNTKNKNKKVYINPVLSYDTETAVALEANPFTADNNKIEDKTAYHIHKRIFDFLCSGIALVILFPLLLVVSLLIRIESKGSAIYAQQRIGKDGRPFTMYKFRSMVQDADEQLETLKKQNEMDGPAFKMKNDPRITRLGRILRRTSIDELPQLINILKGEMSIVGPRPPLPAEVDQYTPYQKQRLQVTPGLTCYWQISGRSNISFDQWVELDIKYIKQRGMITDIKIILKTVNTVFKCIGAY